MAGPWPRRTPKLNHGGRAVHTKPDATKSTISHNRRPIIPVTKEEVEEEKARLRAIDARPIKKVAQAKARQRKKMLSKLQQVGLVLCMPCLLLALGWDALLGVSSARGCCPQGSRGGKMPRRTWRREARVKKKNRAWPGALNSRKAQALTRTPWSSFVPPGA